MTFSTEIIERTEFNLNISFIYFQLSSHIDFVFLNFSGKKSYFKLTYTFCGVRHPWTVHYPKHKTHLEVSLTRSSNFYMTFQVENRELVGDFHHCAYDDPCRKGSNCGNRRFQQQYERLLRGHDWVHFSHWIEIQVVEFLFIFNVAVEKFQLLKMILKKIADIEVHIFDGPRTDSKEVEKKGRDLIMSTFQATVACHKHSKDTFFSSKIAFSAETPVSDGNTLTVQNYELFSFHTKPPTKCSSVFKTVWLKQLDNYSYNVSVEAVRYTGPDEFENTNLFGAIVVYFVDKSGQDEQVLSVSQNMLKQNDSVHQNRRKQYGIVSRITTEYVVLVFYYFPAYSSLEGKLAVSKTSCRGKLVSANCHRRRNINLRNHETLSCLVLSVIPINAHFVGERHLCRRDVQSLRLTDQIYVYYPDHKFRAIQLESHILGYEFYFKGTTVLYEIQPLKQTQNNSKFPITGTEEVISSESMGEKQCDAVRDSQEPRSVTLSAKRKAGLF